MTRPLLGASASAAAAVNAVNEWREYDFDTLLVPATNGTATPVSYHSWTTNDLVGGTYKVILSALAGGTGVSQGTVISITLDIAGAPLPGPTQAFGTPLGEFEFSFNQPIALPPGPATFDLLFAQPTGPGTARMILNTWQIERVA